MAIMSDREEGMEDDHQRNSVLHKLVEALQYTERACNTDVSGYGRGQMGAPLRLSGRPGTWVDIQWQEETHATILAFKVVTNAPCPMIQGAHQQHQSEQSQGRAAVFCQFCYTG